MSKLKRLLLITLTCSMMLILGGCGVELKLSNLNKYVSIGGPNSNTSAVTYAENKMSDALESLKNIKNTYGNLTLDLGSDFSDIIDSMEANLASSMNNVSLINSDGSTTEAGERILNSIVIDDAKVNSLLRECARGIEIAVMNRITGVNTTTSYDKLNFDGTNATSKQKSDVNRTLTLLGYTIEDVKVYFYFANSYDDVTNMYNTPYNGIKSLDAYAASFIKNDYFDNKSCNIESWSVDAKTKPDTDKKDFYYFSMNTGKLNSTVMLDEGKGNEVPMLCKYCDKHQEIKTNMTAGYVTSDDYTACFGKTTHPKCNKGSTAFEWCLHVAEDHDGLLDKSGDFKDLRDVMISQAGLKQAVNPLDDWHWFLKEDGYYTYYENIVAGVKQLCCNGTAHDSCTCTGKTTCWGFFSVAVTFKHHTGDDYIDIRDYALTSKTSKQFLAYPALPAEITTHTTMEDIVEDLQDVSTAKVVVLKDDLSTCTSLSTASDLYSYTKSLGKTMSFGSTSPYRILKNNDSSDFTVNLLDMVAKPGFKVSDAIKEEAIPLYIGNIQIGTWYITTFHEDLASSTNVNSITSNGITSRSKLQRFKVFQGSNNAGDLSQVYILFGLNDILYIDDIIAEELEDDSHKYKPSFNTSTLVYNMLSDNIFSYSSDEDAAEFNKDDVVQFYDSSNIVLNTRTDTSGTATFGMHTTNWYASSLIEEGGNDAMEKLANAILSNAGNSPLVLNTYLEGLYLPDRYENEKFVCLGRKLVFDYRWFDNTTITENTPAFTIYTPSAKADGADDMISHYVNELVSASLQDRTVTIADTEYTIPGLIRLPFKGQTDVIRNYSTTSTLATTSTFRDEPIYSGEFKTSDDTIYHTAKIAKLHGVFAQEEPALHSKYTTVPKLLVWCTSANVNTQLVDYLNSQEFDYWQTWLANNGYPNYLNDTSSEDLVEEIIHQIEMVYDLTFDEDASGKELIIDTSGLDQLDDWINRQSEQKTNAMIDIVLRVIAIILLVYGILLLICYVIDVAVAGEGDGILKKVTFNRMMTVTGLSKEERKTMSQKNEKGTYTTRAVSIGDLLPVILVLWAIATIIIIGSAYNVVDTVLKIAEQITQVVRGAIGKE